ncbi:hypothetical protein N7468_009716 [Penicillium chermesinum]|uniref:Uncharacterized protein n=1 Tax=Penicillium chermesinum TaxID=63820 RepID=A0A9W9NIA8_9EURO|nr:uncharacterized protein N7468_009716 [Penicillium chermesinum]KAJ5220512.1 hypothetical protein N7468_009716 [Penicillium chermesinum]
MGSSLVYAGRPPPKTLKADGHESGPLACAHSLHQMRPGGQQCPRLTCLEGRNEPGGRSMTFYEEKRTGFPCPDSPSRGLLGYLSSEDFILAYLQDDHSLVPSGLSLWALLVSAFSLA